MWALAAIIAAIIWGVYYAVVEQVLQKFSPPALLLASSLIWTVLLAILLLIFRSPIWTDLQTLWSDKKLLAWFTCVIFLGIIAQYLIVFATKEANATYASIVEISYPFFVVLFTWLLFGRAHLSWSVAFSAVLIFSGVGILIYFNR